MDNGKTIKWMEKVFLHGQKVKNIKVHLKKINLMDMENLLGLMVLNIKEIGKMV